VRILVVEDESKVAHAIRRGLAGEGYDVEVAATGEDGFFRLHKEHFDLAILDLMLPGRDGLEILATLRERGIGTPILVLTARDTVDDRVTGLDAGADDYLTKPFAFAELVARVRALSRRGAAVAARCLSACGVELDLAERTAQRDGRPLDLTLRELDLLAALVRHHPRVVSREMLARDVWQETQRATPLDNVIDVHVARLRKKVDHAAQTKLIHTVRGVGFYFGEERP